MEGQILREYALVDFPMLIDVSEIKNGIYLVSVQTYRGIASGKMVICR
jgi:hypothetical protein